MRAHDQGSIWTKSLETMEILRDQNDLAGQVIVMGPGNQCGHIFQKLLKYAGNCCCAAVKQNRFAKVADALQLGSSVPHFANAKGAVKITPEDAAFKISNSEHLNHFYEYLYP